MEKERGIIIIGHGTSELAIAKAKELAESSGAKILTPEQAKELGFKNLPKGIKEIPTLEIKNYMLDDYTLKHYEITSGFKIPKKHNWKRNNKRRK